MNSMSVLLSLAAVALVMVASAEDFTCSYNNTDLTSSVFSVKSNSLFDSLLASKSLPSACDNVDDNNANGDDRVVAIPEQLFTFGKACNMCIRISNDLYSEVFKVIDQTGVNLVTDAHVIISAARYAAFGGTVYDVPEVEWEVVDCPYYTSVGYRFVDGSTSYAPIMKILNHSLPLASVEATVNGVPYTLARGGNSATWSLPQENIIPPYTVTLVAETGERLSFSVPEIRSSDAEFTSTGVQFSGGCVAAATAAPTAAPEDTEETSNNPGSGDSADSLRSTLWAALALAVCVVLL